MTTGADPTASVGTMLGRGVVGRRWWAVPAGDPQQHLVVLDLTGHEFVRAAFVVDDPEAMAAKLRNRR